MARFGGRLLRARGAWCIVASSGSSCSAISICLRARRRGRVPTAAPRTTRGQSDSSDWARWRAPPTRVPARNGCGVVAAGRARPAHQVRTGEADVGERDSGSRSVASLNNATARDKPSGVRMFEA